MYSVLNTQSFNSVLNKVHKHSLKCPKCEFVSKFSGFLCHLPFFGGNNNGGVCKHTEPPGHWRLKTVLQSSKHCLHFHMVVCNA